MTPAIFGATGAVGKELAAEFANRGIRFRAVSRSEEHLRRAFSQYEPLVEYCAADLSDPKAALAAATGIDTIFYTVGVPYMQFKLHPKLTRIALDAALSGGVRRFLLVGTVYPFGETSAALVDEGHPRQPTTFK